MRRINVSEDKGKSEKNPELRVVPDVHSLNLGFFSRCVTDFAIYCLCLEFH